jgi:hypothetical protein
MLARIRTIRWKGVTVSFRILPLIIIPEQTTRPQSNEENIPIHTDPRAGLRTRIRLMKQIIAVAVLP